MKAWWRKMRVFKRCASLRRIFYFCTLLPLEHDLPTRFSDTSYLRISTCAHLRVIMYVRNVAKEIEWRKGKREREDSTWNPGRYAVFYCQQHVLTLRTNILLLSNFYRNIIYVSVKKRSRRFDWERNDPLNLMTIVVASYSRNTPWRGELSIVPCVLELTRRCVEISRTRNSRSWRKEIRNDPSAVLCMKKKKRRSETNDRRRSSLLLLAIARSFRKWDTYAHES